MKRRRSSFASLVLAALAVPALLTLIVSCDGQGGLKGESQADGESLLQQAYTAMRGLDSYHATMTTSGEGIVGSGEAIESDWTAPDSFRTVTPMLRVEGTGDCGRHKAGELRPPLCTDIRGETLEGYSESILVAGRAYGRLCSEKGSNCDEWDVGDAGPLAIMGVTFNRAGWTVTALTMLREAEVVGEEGMDELSTIHLRGQLNAIQAKVDTWRRAAQDAGLETVGEECGSEDVQTPLTEGEPPPTVISTPQCRPITVDEFLALGREAIDRQERNPGSAEVWIGSDDHLVRRFSVSLVADEAGDAETETVVEFSRFNQVVIEAPR